MLISTPPCSTYNCLHRTSGLSSISPSNTGHNSLPSSHEQPDFTRSHLRRTTANSGCHFAPEHHWLLPVSGESVLALSARRLPPTPHAFPTAPRSPHLELAPQPGTTDSAPVQPQPPGLPDVRPPPPR